MSNPLLGKFTAPHPVQNPVQSLTQNPMQNLAAPLGAVTSATTSMAELTNRVAKMPGIDDWAASPSKKRPRPLVLVHGTFGNAYDYWTLTAPMLVAAGYLVYRLDYGQLPPIPVLHGLASVKDSAKELAVFVDRVLEATGADKVDIVGHSQGGMMPRYYLKFLGGAKKVRQFIALSPSNHGTTAMGMTTLARQIPGAMALVEQCRIPACIDQIAGSELLRELNAGQETEPEVQYTVIATKYDEVVTPYTSAWLKKAPNVANILLQELYPTDISDHGLIASDPLAIREVIRALDAIGADGKAVTTAAAG